MNPHTPKPSKRSFRLSGLRTFDSPVEGLGRGFLQPGNSRFAKPHTLLVAEETDALAKLLLCSRVILVLFGKCNGLEPWL